MKAYACMSGLVSDGALSHLPERYGFELYGCDSDVGLVDKLLIGTRQVHVLPPEHQERLGELAHYLIPHKLPLEGSHDEYRLEVQLLQHRLGKTAYSLLTCWE